MPIFIIQPRDFITASEADLIDIKLTPESRKRQVENLKEEQRSDDQFQQIKEWVKDTDPEKVQSFNTIDHNETTGSFTVEMSEEEAAQLQRDLPGAYVFEDEPIELVRPHRRLETFKTEIAETDLWHLEKIGLKALRDNNFTGAGQGVTIAVMDSGIDPDHPELQGKLVEAVSFNERGTLPMNPSCDTSGHGTHVAGLICGSRTGVAPAAKIINAALLPSKGLTNLSTLETAMGWLFSKLDVSIVNFSIGVPGIYTENALRRASLIAKLRQVGILAVCAIGNEGIGNTRSPANDRRLLSVGAIDCSDKVAGFSSSERRDGLTVPFLVAPGVKVYSALQGGGYEAWDGTSMATPIVSGIAALILEKYPLITIADLWNEIFSHCHRLKGVKDERQGYGLVQIPPL